MFTAVEPKKLVLNPAFSEGKLKPRSSWNVPGIFGRPFFFSGVPVVPWATAAMPDSMKRSKMVSFFVGILISIGYGGTKIDFLVLGAKAVFA